MSKDPTQLAVQAQPQENYYGSTIAFFLNNLLGELLTQIDASIVDPIQRKAHKDILKSKFYDTSYKLFNEKGTNIISNAGHIGEIFREGSRSMDDDLDLDSEGNFKK